MNQGAIQTEDIGFKKFIPKIIYVLFLIAWLFFYYSAIDITDWWIENILVILLAVVLFFTRKQFQFSNIALFLVFAFLLLHIYGAKMAYTKNELGAFLQKTFSLQRNPYDRIVHFSFGFLLLYPINELLQTKLKNNSKAFVLLFANMIIFCLASTFELIEWGVAATTNSIIGETYVATQGDVWDAQKDIILAIIGSGLVSSWMTLQKKKTI